MRKKNRKTLFVLLSLQRGWHEDSQCMYMPAIKFRWYSQVLSTFLGILCKKDGR